MKMYFKRTAFSVIGIVILHSVHVVTATQDLPTNWPKCYRNDPNLNECLLKASKQVQSSLKVGVPDLNIAPIEPFNLTKITLQQGTNALNYNAEITNIHLTGLSNYKFSKFDFDVPNLRFDCACDVGFITLEADYKMKGKILLLNLEGEGKFFANLTGLHADVIQHVKFRTIDGIQHFKVESTKTKIKLNDVYFKFDGLFGGSQVLEQAVQEAFSGNHKELIEEFTPALEEAVTAIVEDIEAHLTDNIPADKLYPIK